jgi:serine/threonine-protein kinase
MAAHLEKTPVPPITVDPRLPQALNDVILLSVAKDPNARFQTAGAFANALSNVLPAAQPAAPTVAYAPAGAPAGIEPAKPAAAGSKRGLWMAIGAVAAVLAVVAAIQFGPWRGSKAAPQPGASSVPPIVTQAPAAPSEPVAQPPLQLPEPAQQYTPPVPAKQVSKSPATVAARPQTKTGGSPLLPAASAPAQQAPPTVQQTQPPPVPQAPAQAAAKAAETGPSRQEIRAVRDQLGQLNSRAEADQASLQKFGPGLRADIRQASSQLNGYLRDATDEFNANDLGAAKDSMEKAQRQIDILDKFLGR